MPTLEQVLEQNSGKVKIVFKNFPLRQHRFAVQAAMAALAADARGKFWEFHDRLFAAQNELSEQKIDAIAVGLGFDLEKFKQEMQNPRVRGQIGQDLQDGSRAGIRGTPTVFVNGWLVRNRSLQGFQALIDRELKKLSSK